MKSEWKSNGLLIIIFVLFILMVTSTDAKIRFLSSLLLVSIVFAIGAYFLFVDDKKKLKQEVEKNDRTSK